MNKWIMFTMFSVACFLGITLMLFGMPSKEEAAKEAAPIEIADKPVDIQAAEAVYKQSCISCHGDQLQGGAGPALDKVGGTDSKDNIYKQIMKGGGGMPKFSDKLKEDEVVNLTNWLATMK